MRTHRVGVAVVLAVAGLAAAADLEIHTINVQQGAASLVVGPDGTTVLLDAGNVSKGATRVVPYLARIGLRPEDGLDYTIASHLDADHIGGLREVLASYDVRGANLYNGSSKTNATVEGYFAAAGATSAGGPLPALPGDTIALGDGALLTVVAARGEVLDHGVVDGAEANENDLSVAVLVQYGDFDYLWAGDLGGGEEDRACTGRSTAQANVETPLAEALTPWGNSPSPLLGEDGVDVLHVNHHGSESSTNSDTMNLLNPEVALIAVGAGQGTNYMHPRKDVVENVLLARGECITADPALVLQTEEGAPIGTLTSRAGHAVGDIVITTDGRSGYTVAATGNVSQGPDERESAGLPLTVRLLPTGPCRPDEATLCLNNGRFEVTLHWATGDGRAGPAQAVAMTADAGYFWFFERDNVEVVVKVLDGCGVNGRFWVFAAGLTDVGTTLRVRDTSTDDTRWYDTTAGTAFPSLQDADAFATCGLAAR